MLLLLLTSLFPFHNELSVSCRASWSACALFNQLVSLRLRQQKIKRSKQTKKKPQTNKQKNLPFFFFFGLTCHFAMLTSNFDEI